MTVFGSTGGEDMANLIRLALKNGAAKVVALPIADASGYADAFAQMGGLVAPGTDAGAWQVPHSIDSEYTLLKEALGVSAQAVLDRGIAAIQAKF